MTVKHPKDILQQEIALVDSKLKQPVTVYLIGGGSMSFQGLKDATKDIDGIVEREADLLALGQAMEAAGYAASKDLDPEYMDLSATQIYAKDGAPQWDLFVRVVCKKLRLSPGMKARATPYTGAGANLRLRLIAPEDIFVFKAITERKGDIPDVDVLWAAGLDWEAILDEMRWQCTRSDQAWAGSFLQAMERLDKAGRDVPILDDMDQLVDEELDEWAVLHVLQQPSNDVAPTQQARSKDVASAKHGRSRDEVVAQLQRSSDEDVTQHVEAAIERLAKRGRILDDGALRLNPAWDPDAA